MESCIGADDWEVEDNIVNEELCATDRLDCEELSGVGGLEGNVFEGNVFEGNVFVGKVLEGKVLEGKVLEGKVFDGNGSEDMPEANVLGPIDEIGQDAQEQTEDDE